MAMLSTHSARKYFGILSLFLFILIPSSAQTYDALWKDVRDNLNKDLPKSALEKAALIRRKAAKEHNFGQYLQATFAMMGARHSISPDSLSPDLAQLEVTARAETDPVEAALCHLALADIKAQQLQVYKDSVKQSIGRSMLSAMKDIAALGRAKAKDYVPAISLSDGMKGLRPGDVLNIAAYKLYELKQQAALPNAFPIDSLLSEVCRWYDGQGLKAEAALFHLYRLRINHGINTNEWQQDGALKAYRAFINAYSDVPVTAWAYEDLCQQAKTADERLALANEGIKRYEDYGAYVNELKNIRNGLLRPQITVTSGQSHFYPEQPTQLTLTIKNGRHVQLRAYRTPFSALDLSSLSSYDEDKPASKSKNWALAATRELRLDSLTHHETQRLLDLSLPTAGLFYLETWLDNTFMGGQYITVSRLVALRLTQQRNLARILPLDGHTGHLVSGATLVRINTKTKAVVETFKAQPNGEFHVPATTDYQHTYFLSLPKDRYLPPFHLNRTPTWGRSVGAEVSDTYLFTDREIYKPGQTVHVSGVSYMRTDDHTQARSHHRMTVMLYDAKGNKTDTSDVVTDEFGTFSASFTLPTQALTGKFSLICENEIKTFSVEHYKRPTFKVMLEEIKTAYKLGDTIRVWGKAETYSGVPLRDAQVKFRLGSRGADFWHKWSYYQGDATQDLTQTARTDEQGRFFVDLPLVPLNDDNGTSLRFSVFYFTLTADVISANLETQTATTTFSVGKAPLYLSVSWPQHILKSALPTLTFHLYNHARKTVSGKCTYTIYNKEKKVGQGSFESGQPFRPTALTQLPSGAYRIVCQHDTLTSEAQVTVFDTQDRQIAAGQSELWYRHGDTLYFGTSYDDVTLFHDMALSDGTIISKRYDISNEMRHFPLSYKPEYGNGVTHLWTFVKNNTHYKYETTVKKPQPDKQLRYKWTVFRDRLQPGQKEEWQLQILLPDGKPAKASLMATLYDASLDIFSSAYKPFQLSFPRHLFTLSARLNRGNGFYLFGTPQLSYLPAQHFSHDEFNANKFFTHSVAQAVSAKVGGLNLTKQKTPMRLRGISNMALEATPYDMSTAAEPDEANSEGTDVTKSASVGATNAYLRRNFSETAFFHPQLRTNLNGQVNLTFTLPESLTTWRFRALATTESMAYANIDTTVTATKTFTVQTNAPRFLRQNDRTAFAATIRNLQDTTIAGQLRFEVFDPATDKLLASSTEAFSVAAHADAAFSFPFMTDDQYPMLALRVTAEGATFGDGEQHYIPVLTDDILLTARLPLLLTQTGTQTLSLNKVMQLPDQAAKSQSLSIELSSNPAWYAVMALPTMAKPTTNNAYDVTAAYFAATMAAHIVQQNPRIASAVAAWRATEDTAGGWWNNLSRNPELKQLILSETPWLAEARHEDERLSKLADFFALDAASANRQLWLDKLKALQTAEGGWAWYLGMQPSLHITVQSAVLLAQLQKLTGSKEAETLLARAMTYLDRMNNESVQTMKAWEKKHGKIQHIAEWQAHYLYANALLHRQLSGQAATASDYLISKLEKENLSVTMYGKAMQAAILAHDKKTAAAQLRLKSLLEYTVRSAEMGRYFDTPRAQSLSESYRIATQCAVIDAMQESGYADRQTLNEMRLWLLQNKRTQTWNNPQTTAAAVYTLLSDHSAQAAVRLDSLTHPVYFTLSKGADILATNAKSEVKDATNLGYTYATFAADSPVMKATEVTLHKADEGISWGAVHHTYLTPMSEAAESASGLKLTYVLHYLDGATYRPYSKGQTVPAGTRMRQTLLLTADRDYDFVAIKAPRAACLEPLVALSGYMSGYYRAVADASTSYYYDHLPKGRYEITDEFVTDRTGTYQMGVATVQCVYAPEFGGHSAAQSVVVK